MFAAAFRSVRAGRKYHDFRLAGRIQGNVLVGKELAIERMVDTLLIDGRGGQHEGGLGHAVGREDGLRVEPVLAEAMQEKANRGG